MRSPAGLGWCCDLDKEFSGAQELRELKARGPERKARLLRDGGGRRSRGRECRSRAAARSTSGTHSPMLDRGIGMGLRPRRFGGSGHRAGKSTSAASRAARVSSRDRSTSERSNSSLAASERLSRRPEVPQGARLGPRIEGDEAVLGITWFAQDALGELVHYEPPNEGDTISRDFSLRRSGVREGRLRRGRSRSPGKCSR